MNHSRLSAIFACALGACTTTATDELAEPEGDPVERSSNLVEPALAIADTVDQATVCPANVCDANRMIIGCDERSQKPIGVNAATTAPWRHVGRLSNGCTGTVIGDRWVLTAAHCVDNAGASPLGFSLAQTATFTCSQGTTYVKRVHLPTAFAQTNSQLDRAYDYALLELWSPLAGAVPMAFDYVPWNTVSDHAVHSIGYPSTDKIPGTLWETGTSATLASPNRWLDGGESGLMEVDTDAEGGQSGAPVYAFVGGVRTVVGVLVGSPVAACQAGANWAARLTPGAIEHIDNAMTPNVLDFFWQRINLPWAAPKAGCP